MDDHSEPSFHRAHPTSRRALLAGMAGGAAATAATMALRVPAVAAADGDPMVLGQTNTATSGTRLDAGPSDVPALSVFNTNPSGLGAAIFASHDGGTAVSGGTDTGIGVGGGAMTNGTGVAGGSNGAGGIGVYGVGTAGAIGLRGSSDIGYGLHVTGKVRFASRSGRSAVRAGKTSFARSMSGVTSSSIVIAVLQTVEAGTWVRAAVPSTGKITIYFNRALPSSAVVGWLVLN